MTDLEKQIATLESRLKDCESKTTRLGRVTWAAHRRGATLKESVAELQARELEKGANLHDSNVDLTELEVAGDHVERTTKDDGKAYVRLPDQSDPLDRDGDVALAHGDLLPIQQLSRMDEDMLRSTTNALPTRLAAELWKARTDETVGDDPWRTGSKTVKASVTASDLKHWIRRQEPGTSESYAKKLVSRTIDAVLELSKHRLAVHRRKERKNGLQYTERRVVLPADVEIPGKSAPAVDVPGQLTSTVEAVHRPRFPLERGHIRFPTHKNHASAVVNRGQLLLSPPETIIGDHYDGHPIEKPPRTTAVHGTRVWMCVFSETRRKRLADSECERWRSPRTD